MCLKPRMDYGLQNAVILLTNKRYITLREETLSHAGRPNIQSLSRPHAGEEAPCVPSEEVSLRDRIQSETRQRVPCDGVMRGSSAARHFQIRQHSEITGFHHGSDRSSSSADLPLPAEN